MKKNYQSQIEECILEEIERHNLFLQNQVDQIVETNEQIAKNIKTEFLAIKYLTNPYYEPIDTDTELNTNFNKILINEKLKDMITAIAIEINADYQSLFIKEDNKSIYFDFNALKKISSNWLISSIKYIKLLKKFRDYKQGMRPLKKYKNAIKTILEGTQSEYLKISLEKEYNFYENINSNFLKSSGEIYSLLTWYNKLMLEDKRGNKPSFPKDKLSKQKCNKLEKFIKKTIDDSYN